MRRWLALIVSTLISMWLLKVIMTQKQMLHELKHQNERLKVRSEKLTDQCKTVELYNSNIDLQVTSRRSEAEGLAAKVPEIVSTAEKKKAQNVACQQILKKIQGELDEAQKEQSSIKALIKTHSELWKKEIQTLQGQLTGRSPICNFLKSDHKGIKLCATKS